MAGHVARHVAHHHHVPPRTRSLLLRLHGDGAGCNGHTLIDKAFNVMLAAGFGEFETESFPRLDIYPDTSAGPINSIEKEGKQ